MFGTRVIATVNSGDRYPVFRRAKPSVN